jgi:O-Antigen ligase
MFHKSAKIFSVNSGVKKALWSLPFLLLPIWSLAASVLFVSVGLLSVKYLRHYRTLCWGVIFFLILTCTSQLFAPPIIRDVELTWPGPKATANFIPAHHLSQLVGFNPDDGPILGLVQRKDNFWSMPRSNPITGHTFVEFHLMSLFPVRSGEVYTQSIFFKDDGLAASFQFSFFTARGHHPVATTIVDLGGGLKRAYATYQAQEGDEYVRGLDLLDLQGDWTYLDLAYPQLEPSPTPSAYLLSTPERPALIYRLFWFISMGVLGLLAFAGGVFLLGRVQPNAGFLLLLGLLGTFVLVVLEQLASPYGFQNRAVGLTIHANILGHSAVVCAGLILLGRKHHLTALGFCLALGIIWFSGSRAALVGLLPLLLYWAYSLPRYWKVLVFSILTLGVLVGIWLANLGELGRFTTLFNPNDATTVSRLGIWDVARAIFQQYPLQGGGLGSFGHFYSVLGTETATDLLAGHAHNIFLHLLAESGLLGLLGFIGLLVSILIVLGNARAWANIVLVFSFLLLNLADYTFFNEALYYSFWLAVAWSTLQDQSKVDEPLQTSLT